MQIIFQMTDGMEKVFENVTKIKGNFIYDTFSNTMEVYQEKKKTKIKQSQIDTFVIYDKSDGK